MTFRTVCVTEHFVVLLPTNGAGKPLIAQSRGVLEKVEIKQVAVSTKNPKILLVDVDWVDSHLPDKPIIFPGAIFKKETGNIVLKTQLPDIKLPPTPKRY